MKTHVYIDGFNLYHGCIQRSKHKWLNLLALAENMLPGHQIDMVKFFTARVSASIGDPDQPNRQMIYWRALRTLKPKLKIIEGTFYEHTKSMPIAPDCGMHRAGVVTLIRVLKREEKGSDVNLASHLLMDGWKGLYEQAAVITNDSDLATPISIVRNDMKFPVHVINPHEFHSKKLRKLASSLSRIRQADLAASQFNDQLEDAKGQFHKPTRWV